MLMSLLCDYSPLAVNKRVIDHFAQNRDHVTWAISSKKAIEKEEQEKEEAHKEKHARSPRPGGSSKVFLVPCCLHRLGVLLLFPSFDDIGTGLCLSGLSLAN
jgi:hypothetical protein